MIFDITTDSLSTAVTYCAGTNERVIAAGTNTTIALLDSLKVKKLADLRGVGAFDVYKTFRHNYGRIV